MSHPEPLITLWTWQHPDWDITRDGWDSRYIGWAWEDFAPRLRVLYPWLHELVGTTDFVWCSKEYEHWADLHTVRKLWKLQVPATKLVGVVYTPAWEALRRQKYDKMSEEEARRRVFCGADEKDASPLVGVPLSPARAHDCGRYNLGPWAAHCPYDELPRSLEEAQEDKRKHRQ